MPVREQYFSLNVVVLKLVLKYNSTASKRVLEPADTKSVQVQQQQQQLSDVSPPGGAHLRFIGRPPDTGKTTQYVAWCAF